MTTGQTLNTLEAILDRMLLKISHSSLTLAAKGSTPKPTDMSYHDFWDKIAGYHRQLAPIIREIKTIEHSLDFRSRLARRLPRDMRYRASQSVRSHAGQNQRIYEKAIRVKDALHDYEVQSQTPTTHDVMSGTMKLGKEVLKTLEKKDFKAISEVAAEGRPQIEAMSRDNPVAHGMPLTLVLTLIVIAIGKWHSGRGNGKS